MHIYREIEIFVILDMTRLGILCLKDFNEYYVVTSPDIHYRVNTYDFIIQESWPPDCLMNMSN